MSINRLIYISLIILTCSCASQKTVNKSNEDYQVLNAYLKQNKDSIILNNNSLVMNTMKPGMIFQGYYSLSKRFEGFRTKKEFFNKNQIEELKNKYSNWEVGIWDTKFIKKENIRYIDSISPKTFSYPRPNIKEYYNYPDVYTISKPFYDRKRKKAFLIINIYTKNEGHRKSNLVLTKMEKVKGNWKYNGNSPF